MATYTNTHNLPQPLFEALVNDEYEQVGDISVTGLIAPPMIRQLRRLHSAQIAEDAADFVWRLLGTAVHSVVEPHGQHNRLVEERLVTNVGGWVVSGKPDLLDTDGVLTDYKCTSVYSFLLGDKPDWIAQLNAYAYLYRQYDFEIKHLQIVAILRDWIARRADTDRSYPQCGVLVHPVELWPDDKAGAYIEERVRLHQEAQVLTPDAIPVCTPVERWEKPTLWAVKKIGNKKAMKGGVCDHKWQAENIVASKAQPGDKKPKYEIEERLGGCIRCEHYCNVRPFCPFGSKLEAGAGTGQAKEGEAA